MKTARWLFILTCNLAVFALLVLSLLEYLPRPGFWTDNLAQLRLLYCIILTPLLLCSFLLRKRNTLRVGLCCLLINIAAFIPLYIGRENSGNKDLSIITMNLWGAHNHNYSLAANYIHEKNPDIVCVNEVTKSWMKELQNRLPEYPYFFDEGLSGGAAIFSKLPIERQIPAQGIKVRRYGVRGTVQIGNQAILVIAEHPPSPYMRSNWIKRNHEFSNLVQDVQKSPSPVVLIGDLNATPWSAYFRKLLAESKLEDSEPGHGVQPTYSTKHGIALIPIDHCLVSNQLQVIARELGPNLGSDHLPLYVQLAVQGKEKRT